MFTYELYVEIRVLLDPDFDNKIIEESYEKSNLERDNSGI